MTTQEMTNTVIARVNEMKQNVEIQKIMMGFKTNDEAYDWLVKAAIATLMGVQFAKLHAQTNHNSNNYSDIANN